MHLHPASFMVIKPKCVYYLKWKYCFENYVHINWFIVARFCKTL